MKSGSSEIRQGVTEEQLSAALHDLAQPMTVLLCTLEYAIELNSLDEMRGAMRSALRECERLRKWMIQMQPERHAAKR